METLRTYNGNGQLVTKALPKIVIMGYTNETAIEHIYQNTGLQFVKGVWGHLEAQPTTALQIATLFVTYDFKTQYYDNWDWKNTIVMKHCNNEGFKVDAICFDCVNDNHIHVGTLQHGDKLSV